MKIFITGGAGFVGSNLVEKVLNKNEIVIYDNLSTGRIKFVQKYFNNPKVKIIRSDIKEFNELKKYMEGTDIVFHLQANADVRNGINNNFKDIEENILCTYNVLEAMRINKVPKIIFASSAAIYGEPEIFPTDEKYPVIQTSIYGASKISCEAIIQAFGEYYGIEYEIFRFTAFTGNNYSHGVIFDLVKKLLNNPKELEILGDGKQNKSYIYVDDGIEAMLLDKDNGIYNIGSDETITVKEIADIIVEEMNLINVEYKFSGEKRGWIGDSPFVLLDTSKIKGYGWKPKICIEEAIIKTVKYLLNNKDLFYK